jgi:hypothetical protein
MRQPDRCQVLGGAFRSKRGGLTAVLPFEPPVAPCAPPGPLTASIRAQVISDEHGVDPTGTYHGESDLQVSLREAAVGCPIVRLAALRRCYLTPVGRSWSASTSTTTRPPADATVSETGRRLAPPLASLDAVRASCSAPCRAHGS